jgi:hypothetical protein
LQWGQYVLNLRGISIYIHLAERLDRAV